MMTKEEIIEMARQAGFEGCAELTWENVICTEELEAFAKLVAEKAIKEALAQTQEPVAFASHGVINWIADKQFQHEANLYIAPQRTWVDLTRAQFAEILCDDRWQGRPELMLLQAQSKLKEKNTRGQE